MPLVKPLVFAIGAALAGAILVTAPPVEAQTKDQRTAARAAAEAGGDAFDAGKYAEAADLFERAERLLHAPPHLLYGARSQAKLGHLVEARELYLSLVHERLPDDAPRPFREAQQAGDKELSEIEARLPYVSLVVQGANPKGLRVTRNDQPVPAELIGVPSPVNPGQHSYQAFADGMESTPTTVRLKEGVRETVVLTLRPVPGAAAGAGDADKPKTTLTDPMPPLDDGKSGRARPLLIASIASFAVGAAGLGIGTYFLVHANTPQKQSDQIYTDNRCPYDVMCSSEVVAQVKGYEADATTARQEAVAAYIVGGVGVAAGITLLVLDANRSQTPASAYSVRPIIGLHYAGLSGHF
jgi:hypothetical protein